MNKYISIEIPNKDCKGMFLDCDSDLEKIISIKEANRLVGWNDPEVVDNYLIS